MKRVMKILLIAVLAVSVLATGVLFHANAAVKLMGDVNGDAKTNNRDLGLLQQLLNGGEDVATGDADVNGDTQVDDGDMDELQQMLNGDEEKQTKSSGTSTIYVNLGAPAAARYTASAQYISRCAWDMTIHNGRLYIGCGDYDKNTGPTPIYSAPLSDPSDWREDGVVWDEQVGRFVDYGGVLTIPGYDPHYSTEEPTEYGTYYELIDGEWKTVSTLPHGLHNFDLAWFEGQLFAAIGAPGGSSPVVVTDDGVHYRDLPMYKNGELVVTEAGGVVRSMNIYVLDDALYADFWYRSPTSTSAAFEMYRYNAEEDILEFVADMKQNTHGGKYSAAGLPLWEKESIGDKMFLTTGYLYYTTDFETYTQVTLPNDAVAYDMMRVGGRMYILAAHEVDGQYEVAIYSTTAANPGKLRTEVTFTHHLMPNSFAVDAENFFIGMGIWVDKGHKDNGTILQIKR